MAHNLILDDFILPVKYYLSRSSQQLSGGAIDAFFFIFVQLYVQC